MFDKNRFISMINSRPVCTTLSPHACMFADFKNFLWGFGSLGERLFNIIATELKQNGKNDSAKNDSHLYSHSWWLIFSTINTITHWHC